ncbi:MAG: 2-C-methyl-D-erythritol 4-phosphate cytidylyltransferase [Firmicutes bacterium]|nr:2-C-methyl-D-erythritol 4-phosphate cytidylyltransferase [Bacillota bacterium]
MNIGVIFAGGVGARMRSADKPKQFLEVFHKPIIIHTLEHFEKCGDIDAVVIASLESWIPHLEDLLYQYRIEKVKKIVPGGDTGQLSIYNGLLAAKEVAGDDNAIVLIHDGVRPMISAELLSENIECVKKNGNCITAGIVKETIVVVDENNVIQQVPSRANSRVAKAPQSFYLNDILGAHEKALEEGLRDSIDSCTLMQKFGHTLTMIDGPYENVKITTPDDFFTMSAILGARENKQIYIPEE